MIKPSFSLKQEKGVCFQLFIFLKWYITPWCVTCHYSDVIMGAMVPQITSLTVVDSSIYSGADQRKQKSSVSLAFVRGIHQWPGNSPHQWPVTGKMFPCDDVIMQCTVIALKWRRCAVKYRATSSSFRGIYLRIHSLEIIRTLPRPMPPRNVDEGVKIQCHVSVAFRSRFHISTLYYFIDIHIYLLLRIWHPHAIAIMLRSRSARIYPTCDLSYSRDE